MKFTKDNNDLLWGDYGVWWEVAPGVWDLQFSGELDECTDEVLAHWQLSATPMLISIIDGSSDI